MNVEPINLEPQHWGERLMIVMRRRGIYGYQLAGRARIRPATLSRALRRAEGELSPEQQARVARVLRVPLVTLFPEART